MGRTIREDFEVIGLSSDPGVQKAFAAATADALANSKEYQASQRSSMGLFDFLGDAASAVGSVVQTIANPQTVVGLPAWTDVVGNPVGKLFGGDIGGALADAVKAGGILAGTGGTTGGLFGGGSTAPLFGGTFASPVFGGPAAAPAGGIAGIVNSVTSGDWTGAAKGVLGLLSPKPAAAAPVPVGPPSMLRNAAFPAAGGSTVTRRAIPALPTTIPFKEPNMSSLSIGGPYGVNFSSGGLAAGGFSSVNAGGSSGITISQARTALMKNASDNAGFKITWKKLLYMLLHFGIAIVKQITGLDESQILFLQMTHPHRGRRGPFLRTIEKRVRQAERYKHRVARVARSLHVVGGHHTRRALPPIRRRARR